MPAILFALAVTSIAVSLQIVPRRGGAALQMD